MEKMVFNVEGMACEKCTARIIATMAKIDGIGNVNCDIAAKTIEVEADIAAAEVREAIEDLGFDVV